MVISLRRRPVCHYCGKRNSPVNAQNFKCKHCLADNFLDENGEITDVPIELTQASERYATPLEPFDSSQSIFCSICVKNQNLYTDAMSHYLPEFDHPEYDKFEAAYPEFKRRMEKQYPQCCVKCEPKVQAQLQQATYNAKSDHVRRLLERSRLGMGHTSGWRSLVINGAGLGYVVSLIIQLVWHFMGSQATTIEIPFMRPTDCFTGRPAAQCPDMVEQFMGLSLLLGAISGWWNPKWQHKLKGRPGRLTGLAGYYQAQAAVLVVRFAAWVVLRDLPALEQNRPMLHSLSLVLIALIAGYTNMAIIKVDTTPLVDWKQKQVPLLTEGQFEAPAQSQEHHQNDLLQNLQSTQSRLEPWRPPTPPIDEMDWAPSPANFIPQPKKIVYKSTQPSPFVGTVPALPKQGIYASRAKDQPEPAKAIGIPQGFFDKRDHLKEVKTGDPVFAQPKFFAHNSDTGLESIFGKVFSLDENAVEVRNQPQTEQRYSETASTTEVWLRGFAVVALGMMTVHAIASNYLGFEPKFKVVVGAVLVPILNVVFELTHDMNRSRIVLGLLGCLIFTGLIFSSPGEQSLLSPLWNKLIVGAMSLFILQETFYLCTITTRPEKQLDAHGANDMWAVPEQQLIPEIPTTPRISRRDSMESVSSNISMASTSTSASWKTPRVDHRTTAPMFGRNTRNSGMGTGMRKSMGTGMGSLGLEDFTLGSSVAGPRSRPTRGQGW